jgi:rhodanese-related sulfurtransferase
MQLMGLFSSGESIDAQRAAELLASGDAVPVDVRQGIEWKRGHIQGAVHIPLAHVSGRAEELPRDKTIITVCQSGHRSALAARKLRRAGYRVENLRGGMSSWNKAGLPVERPGGTVD